MHFNSIFFILKIHLYKQIFDQKFEVDAQSKVDASNPGYKKGGGKVQIVNEKVAFDADPKVDASNLGYKKGGGNKQVRFRIKRSLCNYIKKYFNLNIKISLYSREQLYFT